MVTSILAGLCAILISAPSSLARGAKAQPKPIVAVAASEQSFPILNLKKRMASRPKSVEIYQADGKPLGDRQPLLLVHGLNGEKAKAFRWDKVIASFNTSPDFNRTYKVYLARFNTHYRLDKTKPGFRQQLLALRTVTGKPITILALSIGGNVVQESMMDSDVDKAVRLVMTLGTPFHGSPLFTTAWMQYSLYKGKQWIGTRVDHAIAYRIYFAMNSTLSDDLFWDNVDGRIPNIGMFNSIVPFGPRGDLTLQKDVNRRLALMNVDLTPDKSKFVTYAAFFSNAITNPGILGRYKSLVLAPYRELTVEIPAHMAREHAVLSMMNWDISKILTAKTGPADLRQRNQYVLNDGITPLSSALFLPRSYCQDYALASEKDLQRVVSLVDVRKARVFRNADHLTFVDGMRPGIRSLLHISPAAGKLRDELAPADGNHQIFDWITSDLLNVSNGSEDLARNGKDQSDKGAADSNKMESSKIDNGKTEGAKIEGSKIEGSKIEGSKIESLN